MLTPKIMIVDDHAVVRGGIRNILKTKYPESEYSEFGCGSDAIEAAKSNYFDLAFIDISMPGQDGIETLQLLKKLNPKLAVIILSVFREEDYSLRAFQFGAAAYLQKGANQEEIIEATSLALAGKRFITPELAEKLAANLESKSKPSGLGSLSSKEHVIFLKLAAGTSLK